MGKSLKSKGVIGLIPTIQDYRDRLPRGTIAAGRGHDRRGRSREQGTAGPLVSVITVVRNGRHRIEQTVLSVLSQSYKDIEYIIIDGGSTDGTLDIIRKYDDRIAYWISEPDNGIYDAMNKGIALSNGELIALLNSDDYYEQDAVASVVAAYRTYQVKEKSVIYGNYYILDESVNVKTEFLSDLRFWTGMSICHQAMFVTRDVYETISLYDTNLQYASDYAFLVDAIRANVHFIPTKKFLVTFGNAGATYSHVFASYKEALSILKLRFGLFSKYLAMFLFMRVLKSMLVASVKKGLKKFVSRDGLVNLKMIYNKISRRISHKV